MHTYHRSSHEPTVWTVGYFIDNEPSTRRQQWVPLKDFGTEAEAAAYVNYLNGGPPVSGKA